MIEKISSSHKPCMRCNSRRTAHILAENKDRNYGNYVTNEMDFVEFEGKIPNIGLGGSSNSILIAWCLDCGQLQGFFPINIPKPGVFNVSVSHPFNYGVELRLYYDWLVSEKIRIQTKLRIAEQVAESDEKGRYN